MSHAPTATPAGHLQSPTEVLPYASPQTTKPRLTYRGAVTTLVVAGVLLALAVALLTLAWSIFRDLAERGRGSTSDLLAGLGVFVAILAGLSFLVGLTTLFIGLRDARHRELA